MAIQNVSSDTTDETRVRARKSNNPYVVNCQRLVSTVIRYSEHKNSHLHNTFIAYCVNNMTSLQSFLLWLIRFNHTVTTD